jgi:hypothetical protein
MLVAKAKLVSIPGSPYSPGKYYQVERKDKEADNDFEKRTWRERANYDPSTRMMYIPAMAFKKGLDASARFLSIGIKGRGKATFTKHFLAGVLVTESLDLQVKMEDAAVDVRFVPSDGRPGGGRRVTKYFPLIPKWSGVVTYYVIDLTITTEIFEQHLREAGNFIGVGRFRPEKGGFYGRYRVEKIDWSEM